MKINFESKNRRRQGVALLITIIVVLVGAATLASYLLLTENESSAVNRSQIWNNSLTLSEAGVEEALAFMNKYEGYIGINPTNWATAASAAQDNWTVSGTTYTMTRTLTNSGYYTVTIDNSNPYDPTVTCNGFAYSAYSSAQSPFMLAQVGVTVSSGNPTVSRGISVKTVYSALFPDAIDSRTNINLNGNNVRVDSFNSTNGTYSDWNSTLGYGTYDVNKAEAHGNVATDSDITGAISVGQANIYGTVNTGPGGSTTVGNNGYVGPLPQNGSGIQPGYSNDTMNVSFPDVKLPAGAIGWIPTSDGGTISIPGYYCVGGISSGLTINANCTIFVNGSISISGQNAITINTNVTSVTIYVAGPSISETGNAGINNLTQRASVLGIYGLPTLTSVSFGGNFAFNGTLYAPEANFSIGGGGNNTYDYVGAVVAKSVTLNGHANFHYDESLASVGPGRGFIPTKWAEVGAN